MTNALSVDNQQVLLQVEIAAMSEQLAVVMAQCHELEQERDRYQRDIEEYKKLYELVLLELERTRRHLFGQKAERVDPNQVQLAFGELAKALEQSKQEQTSPEQTGNDAQDSRGRKQKPRRRTPHGRRPLPEHLPVERIELSPPELEGEEAENYQRIGEEVSVTVEWRTGSLVRVEVVRPKMVKKGDPEEGVFIAPPVERPIDKGLAGPGLLSHVLVSKFCDHLPLHRIQTIFERFGIFIGRSTMCDWVRDCHELSHLIVEAMWQDVLANASYVATDATGVLVQDKERCRRGHFWVLISENEHVLFRYTPDHTSAAVDKILGEFKGYVQADAATVYDFLYKRKGCTEVGCWGHCRRGFFDAISTDQQRALLAIGYIRKIYEVDRQLRDLSAQDRQKERVARCGPIVEEFYKWADATALEALPQSPIGKAITYARNQRQALTRFLEDGRLRLDNNWSERELRREAVGRKNWLFVGSDAGAEWNATFVSLIASCQLHDIEPWAYLRDILCLLPSWPHHRVLELAPKYWKQTLEQEHTQKLLAANPFRKISAAR